MDVAERFHSQYQVETGFDLALPGHPTWVASQGMYKTLGMDSYSASSLFFNI